MTNPTPQILIDPLGIDLAVWGIRENLVNRLSWLTTAYGVVESVEKKIDGRRVVTPEIFAPGQGNNDYLSMIPDEHLKCYCFFVLDDPEQSNQIAFGQPFMNKAKVSVVFWFDYKLVYPDDGDLKPRLEHNLNNVVAQVQEVLRQNISTVKDVDDFKIYRNPSNIYKGFTIDHAQNQKFTRPYGSFRIEMMLAYEEMTCGQLGIDGNAITAWSTNGTEVYSTEEGEVYSTQ